MKTLKMLLLLFTLSFIAVSCDDGPAERNIEEAGQNIEDAAENTGRAIEEGAENTGRKIEEGADNVKNEIDEELREEAND